MQQSSSARFTNKSISQPESMSDFRPASNHPFSGREPNIN